MSTFVGLIVYLYGLRSVFKGDTVAGLGLILCGMASCATAQAAERGTVGIHVVSAHAPSRDYQNNANFGAYYVASSGVTFGGYRNTLRRTSLYIGYTASTNFGISALPRDTFALTWGAITGYQRRMESGPGGVPESRGFARGAVAPMLAPSVRVPVSAAGAARVFFIPSVARSESSVLHLALEMRL